MPRRSVYPKAVDLVVGVDEHGETKTRMWQGEDEFYYDTKEAAEEASELYKERQEEKAVSESERFTFQRRMREQQLKLNDVLVDKKDLSLENEQLMSENKRLKAENDVYQKRLRTRAGMLQYILGEDK